MTKIQKIFSHSDTEGRLRRGTGEQEKEEEKDSGKMKK